jgi:hypothetical protein
MHVVTRRFSPLVVISKDIEFPKKPTATNAKTIHFLMIIIAATITGYITVAAGFFPVNPGEAWFA